jgi:KaiC/GvpD/RAD55 family RecA-like ATPase
LANASPRASPIQLIQSQLNTTNLFTAHLTAAAQNTGNGIEQFLASGVLVFKAAESNGKSKRALTVRKMRGTAATKSSRSSKFSSNRYAKISGVERWR